MGVCHIGQKRVVILLNSGTAVLRGVLVQPHSFDVQAVFRRRWIKGPYWCALRMLNRIPWLTSGELVPRYAQFFFYLSHICQRRKCFVTWDRDIASLGHRSFTHLVPRHFLNPLHIELCMLHLASRIRVLRRDPYRRVRLNWLAIRFGQPSLALLDWGQPGLSGSGTLERNNMIFVTPIVKVVLAYVFQMGLMKPVIEIANRATGSMIIWSTNFWQRLDVAGSYLSW